jgi:hypothetical protein
MKERPILFSGPMVRAILEGRKTQTRRVVKQGGRRDGVLGRRMHGDQKLWPYRLAEGRLAPSEEVPCPYGMPGDRLWVRETWYCDDFRVQAGPYLRPDDWGSETQERMMYFRASHEAPGGGTYTGFSGETMNNPWRPAIHMPRWASRISLELTGVRVERLHDLTTGDANAEGFPYDGPQPEGARIRWYRELWDSLNTKRGFGWERNPWVWVIEFRRVENGDARRPGTPD